MLSAWENQRQKLAPLFLVFVAVLLVSQLPEVKAGYERVCYPDSANFEREGYCGDQLVVFIEYICNIMVSNTGKYLVKRSYPSEIDREVHDILLNKKDAFSYLAKRQSNQNIICECCVNRCSVMELSQYCELPSSRRVRSGYPKLNNM